MMKPRIVIKLGGSSLQNPETLKELAGLMNGYQKKFSVVLVHGGGPAINQELIARGIEWKFINGQRQTTPQMMGVIDEVLATQVNGRIVQSLKDAGFDAIGLSGARDQILFCKHACPELMQVGAITHVNTEPIENILVPWKLQIPVIAPIGVNAEGEKFNINADWAATQIAIALQAKKLMFLTDQDGILGEKKKLLKSATPEIIHKMIESGVISGGMQTKVLAMITALDAGVRHVHVLNAGNASQVLQQNIIGTLLKNPKPKGELHDRAS